MDNATRVAVVVVGLLNVVLGFAFLVRPEAVGALFYVTPIESQGMATIRADLPGFFVTGGAFALWGVRMRLPDALKVPITLLGIALFGRFVSLVFDGIGPSALPPMIAEVVMIGIPIAGTRSFVLRR
jgi:hypothetical protein